VFGLKPTWGVVSPKGQALPGTHADADISVVGPLARGAADPAGLAKSGLPVGYQAIAASGRDKTATAFSRFIEKEIVGFTPPPGFD
jgi:Asp-tRNA(Asn)/Glu-tRNA(Gln) amidotransferase A subunit family amidase